MTRMPPNSPSAYIIRVLSAMDEGAPPTSSMMVEWVNAHVEPEGGLYGLYGTVGWVHSLRCHARCVELMPLVQA
jgi:hypothetical protein